MFCTARTETISLFHIWGSTYFPWTLTNLFHPFLLLNYKMLLWKCGSVVWHLPSWVWGPGFSPYCALKGFTEEAGERAQQLRVPAALSEDLSSVPSTSIRGLPTTAALAPEHLIYLSSLWWHLCIPAAYTCGVYTQRHTHTHIKYIHKAYKKPGQERWLNG